MSDLLKAKNIFIKYETEKKLFAKTDFFTAVSDFSFTLNKGEILALVGESGCGKSTLAKSLVGLTPISSGALFFHNEKVNISKKQSWIFLRKKIQMIFQDPYSSLNPRQNICDILTNPLVYQKVERSKRLLKAKQVLEQVGIPQNALEKYPHEFSGGQRQRIGIARALMTEPEILICDEVTSALDVSVQAQILHLLNDLVQEFHLSLLFISHDLQVVETLAERVLIMQKGKLVEEGFIKNIFQSPKEEYTKKLLAATPVIE